MYLIKEKIYNLSLPVVLIMHIMCDILEILHVCLDEEPPQERKVRVLGVVNLNEAPRVLAAADLLALDLKLTLFTHATFTFKVGSRTNCSEILNCSFNECSFLTFQDIYAFDVLSCNICLIP